MRFLVYPRDRLRDDAIERAYVTGQDRSIWPSTARETDEGCIIEPRRMESGCVHLPWEVAGRGDLVLSTAWLMKRQASYHLQVELARGSVFRVRKQLDEWLDAGLTPSPRLRETLAQATRHFSVAATRQDDPKLAAIEAEQAIALALDAADELIACYSKQAIAARREETPKLPACIGARLDGTEQVDDVSTLLEKSINCGSVPVTWGLVEHEEGAYDWDPTDSAIDWLEQRGMPVLAGPLVAFDEFAAPVWGKREDVTSASLSVSAMEFATAAVKRYRGRVAAWNCAARLNIGNALALSPEERLRIGVQTVDAIRRHDVDTPIIMTFDRPWAEYMNKLEIDPPLYVADTLIRAGLGLAGVGVEINLGFEPLGTPPRNFLDISQLLDQWSIVDVPLWVFLSVPSALDSEPPASDQSRVDPRIAPGGPTPDWQADWVRGVLGLALAKPFVKAVVWNQLSDARHARFPSAGLIDQHNKPKPALTVLQEFQQDYIA